MIRIGLLGAANIAPAAIVKPVAKRGDCQITAVGCRDKARGAAFAARHGLPDRVMSYGDICRANDIDMIYCALPPSSHAEWVPLALETGKAVLCEKPFSMGIADAKLMAEASRNSGVPLMEAFHYYFHPVFQNIRDIVKSGCHGPVTSFDGEFNISLPFQDGQLRYDHSLGGGGLMDLGCYPLHAFRSLIGEPEIINVQADIQHGVDVSLSAELRSGGVGGHISCTMALDAHEKAVSRFRVSFENGYLEITGFVAPHLGYEINYVIDGASRSLDCENPITYDCQLDHFIDVVNGRTPALPLDDAIMQMIAIETIYKKCGLR